MKRMNATKDKCEQRKLPHLPLPPINNKQEMKI
jgi:hypothetical protein